MLVLGLQGISCVFVIVSDVTEMSLKPDKFGHTVSSSNKYFQIKKAERANSAFFY